MMLRFLLNFLLKLFILSFFVMERSSTVVVASLQASSAFGSVEANTSKFTALCRQAAAAGAKILVLPETSISGYLSEDLSRNWCLPGRANRYPVGVHPCTVAQDAAGPIVQHFCTLAFELQCYITVPFLEVVHAGPASSDSDGECSQEASAREDLFYNSISLVGPKGTVCAHYRKNFPWPHPERSWATPGTDVAVFDTEYGRVGLAVCYDIHGILVKYARHKIWVLLHCVAWVGSPKSWFLHDLPSRLRQVSCPHYIVGCNWATDVQQQWPGAGYSTHYGPYGEVLASAQADIGSEILYSTISTACSSGGRLPASGCPGLDLDKYAAWTSMQMVRERSGPLQMQSQALPPSD
jgi:predicted amidohydrolase